MSESFKVRVPVRFAHCDPAGIAYYPRYFELCDGAVEDWCDAVLKVSRRVLHLELGLGLPTVVLDASFFSPSRLGDWLDIGLSVKSVGRTSVELEFAAFCQSERRFTVNCKQVLMDLTTARPRPWPSEWRERLRAACA